MWTTARSTLRARAKEETSPQWSGLIWQSHCSSQCLERQKAWHPCPLHRKTAQMATKKFCSLTGGCSANPLWASDLWVEENHYFQPTFKKGWEGERERRERSRIPLLTTFSTRLGSTTLAKGILTGSLLGCTVLRGILMGRLVMVSPLLAGVLSRKACKHTKQTMPNEALPFRLWPYHPEHAPIMVELSSPFQPGLSGIAACLHACT